MSSSSGMVNIAGVVKIDDPEYRYQMPRIIAKIEGRGNGIKTVVVNCVELAAALHRTPAEVCKFFGCELGAQSKYDAETERAVVNGAFTAQDMQTHLSKYIESFVLCPCCRLPESTYKYRKENVFHKCFACGAEEMLDMTHKLTNFIVQQRKKKKKESADKDEKKKTKKSKKKAGTDTVDQAGDEQQDGKKKVKKEKKSKKKHKEAEKGGEDDLPNADEVEWHTDFSEEAVAARLAEAQKIEQAAQNALNANKDDEDVVATLDNLEIDDQGAIENASSALRDLMKKSPTEIEVLEEIKKQQTYAALPASQRMVIFFNAAFNGNIITEAQVAKHASVMGKFVVSKEEQFQLIAHCELFCSKTYAELLTAFPVVLKLFYDEDILDEANLLSWESVRPKFALSSVTPENAKILQSSMQPLINWLQNAEEESDDEE